MRMLIFLSALLLPILARAAEPVDVALVLVSDVSRSVDDSEFNSRRPATRAAFVDPRVQAAIKGGPIGAIAVAYVEFAGNYEVRTVRRLARGPRRSERAGLRRRDDRGAALLLGPHQHQRRRRPRACTCSRRAASRRSAG